MQSALPNVNRIMLGRTLLLVCLLGFCGVESSGPKSLHGKEFGSFFTSKMVDAFAKMSGRPFPLLEVPYEMKVNVDES